MDKNKIIIAMIKQRGKKSKNEIPSMQPPVTVGRRFSEGYPTSGSNDKVSAADNTYHSASGNYSGDTNSGKNIPTFAKNENKNTTRIVVRGRTFPKLYL